MFGRIAYVCSKVAVATAIVCALVFGQAIRQYHHVLSSATASGETTDSGRCSCQTCPFHSRDASDQGDPEQNVPQHEHNCGVCQVLLQAADPPPAVILGDCFSPKMEFLTVASEVSHGSACRQKVLAGLLPELAYLLLTAGQCHWLATRHVFASRSWLPTVRVPGRPATCFRRRLPRPSLRRVCTS